MNATEEEPLVERDDTGRSYSSIVRDANQAILAMCETSRELMAYYEKDIRTTKMEDLNGAIHARFISNEAKFLNPQLSLECSRDIPANVYRGARTIYHAEIANAQKFLLGICREHYNDHGVEVYVTESPKTAAEALWNTGAFINVAIVNTSIIMKPMLVVVTNARKKIYRGNLTKPRLSALPYQSSLKTTKQLPTPAPVTPSNMNVNNNNNNNTLVSAIASVFSPQPPSFVAKKINGHDNVGNKEKTLSLKLERSEDSPNVIIVNTNPDNIVVNDVPNEPLLSKSSSSIHDPESQNDHERKKSILPPITKKETENEIKNESNE